MRNCYLIFDVTKYTCNQHYVKLQWCLRNEAAIWKKEIGEDDYFQTTVLQMLPRI